MPVRAIGFALVLLVTSSGLMAQIPDGVEGSFLPHPQGGTPVVLPVSDG